MKQCVGLHLGGLVAEVADASSADGVARLRRRDVHAPPAIVQFDASAAEYHDSGPVPLPGAGLPWPPIASGPHTVDVAGDGRVPLPMVWQALVSDSQRIGSARNAIRPESALALAGISVVGEVAEGDLALVIPNSTDDGAQQRLIDAYAVEGLQAVLVWRPVAGALAWLEHFADELLRSVRSETVVGHLLVVHVGLEGVEANWLELILRSDTPGWLYPARRRPTETCAETDRAVRWLSAAISRQLGGSLSANAAQLGWRAAWSSPMLLELFRGSSAKPDLSDWGIPIAFVDGLHARLQATLEELFIRGTRPWLAEVRRTAVDQTLPQGAIVTGDLAAFDVRGRPFGAWVVEALAPKAHVRTCIEGVGDMRLGALARSAARYAARRAGGLPTYLDSLPDMEALAEVRARPEWRKLVNPKDKYVKGGEVWRDSVDLGGMRIAANTRELELSIWVESGTEVRRVKFQIPEPPKATLAVHLDVQIEPAQGRARVELVPERLGAFGNRRVLLDWVRAEASGLDREAVAERYPRKCPQVQPRESWDVAARELDGLVRELSRIGSSVWQGTSSESYLSKLRDAINKQPATTQIPNVRGRTISMYRSLDSEGRSISPFDRCLPQLQGILAEVARVQVLRIVRGEQPLDVALRTLGYACAQGGDVDTLVDWVLQPRRRISSGDAVFLAGCMRPPHQVDRLLEHLLSRLRENEGIAEIMKSTGYMLQWREEALDEVNSGIIQALVRELGLLLSRSIETTPGSGVPRRCRVKMTERSCLVLIAFLLRKRITDDAFLDPQAPIAIEVKRVLSVALQGLRSGVITSIGGMVSVEDLVYKVTQYIERRGTGTVIAD